MGSENDILDYLDLGIIKLDCEFKCVYKNQFIQRNFGYFNTQLDVFLQNIHCDDSGTNIDKLFTLTKNNEECECRILTNVDRRVYNWFKISKKIINDEYLYTFKDISDYKVVVGELIEEKKISEKAYNHKTLFLANVSHEIRTPLNGIVGMITLLEDTDINSEQKDFIEMMRECCINLMTIINDILDFSKLEAGKIKLEVKCDNLRKCIESTNDILLSKLYEKDLDYKYSIDSSIPDYIKFDASRLKQILLNLLTNSIKFTEEGSIKLNIVKMDSTHLKFSIKDSGCGIHKDEQDKLFKSFSQIQNNTKMNEGTGLGLAISKQLVELMGGKIWIEESVLGNGSTFSFIIKIENCENVTSYVFNNNRVFILDDVYQNRIHLSKLVKGWGMVPISFSSPKEALFMLKQQEYDYDLGFVDIRMPEMSGQIFSDRLKEDMRHCNKNIPLIALSSLGEIKHSEKYFDAYLIKPPKETKLKEICKELLNTKIQLSNKQLDIDLNKDIKTATRILLVEDVPINQRVVISFLKKLGFKNVDVVDNGKNCLEILCEKKYDLILLDLRMPIMNGEEVFKYILNYYNNRNRNTEHELLNKDKPYIIAVTAHSLKEDRDKYLEMGFDDYIPKPISIKFLKECLDKFILHHV